MPGTHAILSPSSAYRWLVCTPSARFEEQIPEEESEYAAEGTLAHELAARLLSRKSYDDIAENELYSAEMLEHCNAYAEYVREVAAKEFVYVEHLYDMSRYIPMQYGTCDASFIKNATLYVIDFKYGAGVKVAATANKQMMCYALGAYDYHAKGRMIDNICLTIYQPRAGGVSTWELPVGDLLQWAKTEAGPKSLLAFAGQGEFIPGEHCHFCRARTVCKAYYDRFADVKRIKDKRVMTDSDIAKVLTYGPQVASWVKKVEEDTVKRLQNNKPLKGFKLVEGRGRRSFKDEDEVVDIMLGEGYEDEIFDSSLKPLTAIEKLVGPKKFKTLFDGQIVNVPGKPQIAPIDDARPAIGASAADEYDEEDT